MKKTVALFTALVMFVTAFSLNAFSAYATDCPHENADPVIEYDSVGDKLIIYVVCKDCFETIGPYDFSILSENGKYYYHIGGSDFNYYSDEYYLTDFTKNLNTDFSGNITDDAKIRIASILGLTVVQFECAHPLNKDLTGEITYAEGEGFTLKEYCPVCNAVNILCKVLISRNENNVILSRQAPINDDVNHDINNFIRNFCQNENISAETKAKIVEAINVPSESIECAHDFSREITYDSQNEKFVLTESCSDCGLSYIKTEYKIAKNGSAIDVDETGYYSGNNSNSFTESEFIVYFRELRDKCSEETLAKVCEITGIDRDTLLELPVPPDNPAIPDYPPVTPVTPEPKVKNPAKTKIKKIKKGKKRITVFWVKKSGIKGYEIQISTSKKFKKSATKTVTIKKAKTTKKVIKKLNKKKYFVRIRTYKIVKGKKYVSKWSKAKTVKFK